VWSHAEVTGSEHLPETPSRSPRRRRLLLGFAALGALFLIVSAGLLWRAAEVGAGYGAKLLCSGVFLSGRTVDEVLGEDLDFLPITGASVDSATRTARVSIGPVERQAVFRPGLGSVLVLGDDPQALAAARGVDPEPTAPAANPLPSGAAPPGLDEVLGRAFEEPDDDRPVRTHAVLVLQGGRVLAERYAPGFDADTPHIGWSMTKSVLNALIGVLVREGRLDVHQPAPVTAWRAAGDPRGEITVDHLLRMSSGLRFDERYMWPLCDAVEMLFRQPDVAGFAAALPLDYALDTHWAYSSGTSNILAGVILDALDGDRDAYRAFPRRALFEPLGLRRALIETDASGTFIASSFGYATAREWARFGQLYLQDGMWEGRRLLPEGWVDYSRTPTPPAPQGRYGAHFWLNAGAPDDPRDRLYPSLPRDLYYASGFQGQTITVVPSRDAVIVRLGRTNDRDAWSYEAFVREVLEVLP
jgi:CubicO group peptidase (beta-lactamase class C family)